MDLNTILKLIFVEVCTVTVTVTVLTFSHHTIDCNEIKTRKYRDKNAVQ